MTDTRDEGAGRALVLACWPVADALLRELDAEPALLEIAGKATAQRAVEQAVALGARRIDVVLGENAVPYAACLGTGERWGCEIVYHYSRPGRRPLQAIGRRLADQEDVLLLHADGNLPDGHAPAAGSIGCRVEAGEVRWCGWGRLPGAALARCLERADSRDALGRALRDATALRHDFTGAGIEVTTAAGVLAAARQLFDRPAPPIGIARRPAAPGLWVGNGCRVHGTARLMAPVFLGDHVMVGAGAVVGPGAVVGDGSIVDRDAVVADTVVLAGSYIGEGVELNGSLLAGRRLVNATLGAALEVPDRELASPLAAGADGATPGVAERTIAAVLWTVLWPVRALLRVGAAGPVGASACEAVLQGHPGALRRHFRECFHPGLAEVVRGRRRIVGPLPGACPAGEAPREPAGRNPRSALPGLVNDALLLGPEAVDPAIRFACDTLAAKKSQIGDIVRATLRYARAVAHAGTFERVR
jgi:hypothetical protein